jgi:uncharacterized protein (DUF736 family)
LGSQAGQRPSLAFSIAIEAAAVAGSKTVKGRGDMATIGSFNKVGDNEFQGEIATLAVQAKGVVSFSRPNDNASSHRVYVGRVEIGAGWSRRPEEGRGYLSLKLDAPSYEIRAT